MELSPWVCLDRHHVYSDNVILQTITNTGANHTQTQTTDSANVSSPSERNHVCKTIHLPFVTPVLTDLIGKIRDKSLRLCFKLGEISDHRGRAVSPSGNDSVRRHHFVIVITRSEETDFGQLDDVA